MSNEDPTTRTESTPELYTESDHSEINQHQLYVKYAAMVLFIVLPFIGFWFGFKFATYLHAVETVSEEIFIEEPSISPPTEPTSTLKIFPERFNTLKLEESLNTGTAVIQLSSEVARETATWLLITDSDTALPAELTAKQIDLQTHSLAIDIVHQQPAEALFYRTPTEQRRICVAIISPTQNITLVIAGNACGVNE